MVINLETKGGIIEELRCTLLRIPKNLSIFNYWSYKCAVKGFKRIG